MTSQPRNFDLFGSGRRNVFGSMPAASFMRDDTPHYENPSDDLNEFDEDLMYQTELQQTKQQYGAPIRKGLPHSPSFDRVAERLALKRGDSDGNLLSQREPQIIGLELDHARSASADALGTRNLKAEKQQKRQSIRQTLLKKGDSLASFFRPSSKTNINGSDAPITQKPHAPHTPSHADTEDRHGSSGRIGGWGATLMRKTRPSVIAPMEIPKYSGTGTLKMKGPAGFGGQIPSSARSSISKGAGDAMSPFSELSSRHGGDGPDDMDDDSESIGSSIDDLSLWISNNSMSSLWIPKTLQLSVEHRGKTLHVRVLSHGTVAETIQSILIDIAQAAAQDGTEFVQEADRAGYRLCKMDRHTPGVRTWMDPSVILGTYDVKQGDEVRLKHTSDIEKASIIVPPSHTPHIFEYGFDVLVKEAVASVRAAHLENAAAEEKYGLYYPRLGIWLDDGKTLFSYDLQLENNLELRALANQFLLRIYLPEFDQKIALKVLPSLRTTDIMAMVHTQLSNRKLTVASHGGRYGLFIPSVNIWMKESAKLEEYPAAKAEDVQYKLQYELVSVLLESAGSHSNTPSEPLKIFVDATTTVETLIETVALNSAHSAEEMHCLFSPAGDKINDRDLVWAAVKDLAVGDALRYRAVPKSVILSNTSDSTVKIDLDIDFARPLSRCVPLMCRRFGVRLTQVDAIKTDGGIELDRSKSLNEQRVTPGTKLILQINKSVKEKPPAPASKGDGAVNIWDEPDSDENLQMTKDAAGVSCVGSGTLNKLVEKLTDEKGEGTSQYLDYVKTFLLTYQSFTTGAVVLRKLIERYHAPRSRKSTFATYDHFRLTIQLRVCNVLLQWVKRHPTDFLKPKDGVEFWADAMRFVEDVLGCDHPSMARQIRKNLVKMKDNTHPALARHAVIKSPQRPAELDPRKLSVFKYPIEEIAQQLTLIEHAFFADILPSELLNQAWNKSDAAIKAPNVLAVTKRFNAVACWTAKSILEMKTPRSRAKRITSLVELASHVLTLNNYSSLMAIIAGLNKASIIRLKQTFKEVGSKTLKKLTDMERLMTAEGSYKSYRAHLRTVTAPCIPYIGVYLIDLTYMEDGNPDMISHRINFTKRQMISSVINEIVGYQQVGYKDIKPVDELYHVIARLPAATDEYEKILWAESKKRE